MGTKVQIENYLPGHYSVRDPSHESNGAGWPSCCGESSIPNGQFYHGFLQRTVSDSHSIYDEDVVKQTMLEHEAVFKNQVRELHRLYRVQRDLMDEARRNEQFKRQILYEGSSSSSPVPSHMRYEDTPRCNGSSLPLASPEGGRPLMSGQATTQSSPNSVKGKNIQPVPIPFQNGHSPKNSEVFEYRPTKFRQRMLDLQLPADEYIDTDEVEQCGGAKAFDLLSISLDKTNNSALGKGKMFLNYARNTECQGDVSSSDILTHKPNVLADLNEPLLVEEVAIASSVELLGPGGSYGDVTCREFSTRLLSSSKDAYQNSNKDGMNSTLQSFNETRANGQDPFCYASESEQYKGSMRFINQGIHPEKAVAPSQAGYLLPGQQSQHSAVLSSDYIKRDPWKANYVGVAEKSDPGFSSSSYVDEQIMTSHASRQPGLFHYSDLGKPWDLAASNWRNPNGFKSQKSASVQTSPLVYSANFSRSPQLSAHISDSLGNKWDLNRGPVANAAFGSELPVRNGYYQGASTVYKDLPARFPPTSLDYGNCSYEEETVPCSSNSYFKATSYIDVNHPAKEMNLNVAVPNGVLDDHVIKRGMITTNYCKSEDPVAALPWLRGKGAYSNEAKNLKGGLNSSDFSQCPPVPSISGKGDTKPKKPEISQKILGVSIYDNTLLPKEISAVMNRHVEIQSSQRIGRFDINTPCESIGSKLDKISVDDFVVVKKMKTESVSLSNHFDLNLCITEEDTLHGAFLDSSTTVKVGTGIDLEAPVVLEDEDISLPVKEMKEPDLQQSSCNDGEVELIQSAAAAIVNISSCANNMSVVETTYLPPEADMDDRLKWFADLACSSENIVDGDGLPEGLDDFEAMILRMEECTAEEYFPKPSIPEFPIGESTRSVLTTRTRKGPGRRGKQKRDFQRDILPGLTTLSRHEVTEDLQMFGGLMRATGYPWHSGSNRRNASRNGSARGRRRSTASATATPVVTNTVCALPLKQQQQKQLVHINNTEVGLEDRSLRGWGKTTRRPRRQRCPASNPPPPVPLPNYLVRGSVNQ